MSANTWRVYRAATVYAFYVGCIYIVAYTVLMVGSFLMIPFTGFSDQTEFTELSGAAAKWRLADWPDGVHSGDVKSVFYKHDTSRDSYSSWYRIDLAPDAASIWEDSIHDEQVNRSRQHHNHLQAGLEGVKRELIGPPPLHHQTGETPTWWTPPNIAFRATEAMLWYANYDSGVGRATYSAFDDSTGILWVYEYAAQHDQLWSPRRVPAGDRFSTRLVRVDQY